MRSRYNHVITFPYTGSDYNMQKPTSYPTLYKCGILKTDNIYILRRAPYCACLHRKRRNACVLTKWSRARHPRSLHLFIRKRWRSSPVAIHSHSEDSMTSIFWRLKLRRISDFFWGCPVVKVPCMFVFYWDTLIILLMTLVFPYPIRSMKL